MTGLRGAAIFAPESPEESGGADVSNKVAIVTGTGSAGPSWGNDKAVAALFLASDKVKYITGIQLVVDGGLTCKVN